MVDCVYQIFVFKGFSQMSCSCSVVGQWFFDEGVDFCFSQFEIDFFVEFCWGSDDIVVDISFDDCIDVGENGQVIGDFKWVFVGGICDCDQIDVVDGVQVVDVVFVY